MMNSMYHGEISIWITAHYNEEDRSDVISRSWDHKNTNILRTTTYPILVI